MPIEPDMHQMTPDALARALEVDPTLDENFFNYSDAVRDKIAECVAFKAQHNQRTMKRLQAA